MPARPANPDHWTTTYTGPGDPAEVFYNVGVRQYPEDSPYAGDNSVNHFYYGVVGEAFAREGHTIAIPNVARWVVQIPGTHENAHRIWRNRGPISDVVASHGGEARLWVKFDGDTMRLTEYDWRKWTVDVPALP